MGGDLNLALNPELDTSTGKSDFSKSRLRKFKKALLDRQIIDVWRMLHPDERDYSFYSAAHKSYGRLDYFLLHHVDMPRVKKATMGNIIISDHSAVCLLLDWVDMAPRQTRWRLNESLIQNIDTSKKIREEMELFFSLNDTADVGAYDFVGVP